jgi:hypothetical protein
MFQRSNVICLEERFGILVSVTSDCFVKRKFSGMLQHVPKIPATLKAEGSWLWVQYHPEQHGKMSKKERERKNSKLNLFWQLNYGFLKEPCSGINLQLWSLSFTCQERKSVHLFLHTHTNSWVLRLRPHKTKKLLYIKRNGL